MYFVLHPFYLSQLFAPTAMIFFVTLFCSWMATRSLPITLIVALIRAGLFVVYFGYIFDGTYTFRDDLDYLMEMRTYISRGIGITNILPNWDVILSTSGTHFAYQIYGTYATKLFGLYYFAPVAFNVALTAFTAWFGSWLAAEEFGVTGAWRKWFFAFLLIHPDILVWSTFANLKDSLILFIHVILLIGFSRVYRGKVAAGIVMMAPATLVLLFLRFYLPVLFMGAFFMPLIFSGKKSSWLMLLFLAIPMMALVLFGEGVGRLQYALDSLRQEFVNPVLGFVRFLLSPVPLNTEPSYKFLEIPALFNWLCMPLMIYGVFLVARMRTQFSRFFLFYLGAFVLLYSAYGQLQGPRHRLQLDFAWALLQFLGFVAVARQAMATRSIGDLASPTKV